jgi:hypothetical protein
MNRAVIIEIKAACWHHPEYRRGFTSADVYEAVVEQCCNTGKEEDFHDVRVAVTLAIRPA